MSANATLLIASAVIGAVSIPLILKLVPPNRLYGLRTRLTLSDRALWFRVNRFAGVALLIAAALSGALLGVMPEHAARNEAYQLVVFLVPLTIALGASFVYLRRAAGRERRSP